VESNSNKSFRSVDAFLLAYLPKLVKSHFQSIEILLQSRDGAGEEMASRVETLLRMLQERGPEIVSCVWQIESILGDRLRVQPPAPPQSEADVDTLSHAIDAAFKGAPESNVEDYRTAYAFGMRCGTAETLLAVVALHWALWAAAPDDAKLRERSQAFREELSRLAASPGVRSDSPTMQNEDEAISHALSAAATIAAGAPGDASAVELLKIRAQLRDCARALESATLGTPRAAIRAWRDKQLSGIELMRRLAEHYRWSVPCRIEQDGKPEPRVLTFDKRVLMVFSDPLALAGRPTFLRAGGAEDQLYLTFTGATLFRQLADANVDVLVLDPTDDPQAPHTINYPREMHGRLREVADEAMMELAACDWSRLDLAPLRAHHFWILAGGGSVHNLMAPDGYGRPRIAMFSTEAALEAHLSQAAPEQARDFAHWQRLLAPGEVLFPSIASLDVAGIILNPSGPGRTRAFNSWTVKKLAGLGT
jgi:hypothetical protein